MTTIRWRGRFITSVVVVLALIVTALLVGLRDNNGSGDSKPSGNASTTTTTTTTNPGDDSEVPDGDRTVLPGDVLPEAARCASDKFIPNSLPSTEKLWSTSVSTPYVSQDPNEMFTEKLAENCGNPTLLEGDWQMFSLVPEVWDANPWMAEAIDLVNELGLRAAFLTTKPGVEGVFVTPQYTMYAEMTNTILLDYKVRGKESWMSIWNWYLPHGSTTAGELPRVVENPNQEGLPALILVFTDKGMDCTDPADPGAVIGSNEGDKRNEIFGPPKCNETPPCSTNCGTTPPTTIVCGNKNHLDENGQCVPNLVTGSTTPPSATTQPSGPTTTLACVYGTHRDPATGGCVTTPPSTVAPPGSIPSTTSPPGPGTTVLGP